MEGRKQQVVVQINRHTMSIAGQIYQLRNIARVQCWKLTPARGRAAYQILKPAFALLLALGVLNLIVENQTNTVLVPQMTSLNIFAVLAICGVTAARLVRMLMRRAEYVLLLETTGNPIGVLSSGRRQLIEEVVTEIQNAIEDPPDSPRVFHLGDVILGDQINQQGDKSIGKVLHGG